MTRPRLSGTPERPTALINFALQPGRCTDQRLIPGRLVGGISLFFLHI
jgi:hypothetical protein